MVLLMVLCVSRCLVIVIGMCGGRVMGMKLFGVSVSNLLSGIVGWVMMVCIGRCVCIIVLDSCICYIGLGLLVMIFLML